MKLKLSRSLLISTLVLVLLLSIPIVSCQEEPQCDPVTYYRDLDEDGYGDPFFSESSCSAVPGYVLNSDDCDDSDNSVYPGGPEICDNADNDCDGTVDEEDDCPIGFSCVGGECLEVKTWYEDRDGDTYGNPDATKTDVVQPAGYVADNTDCNDDRTDINPGAAEVCNGLDDNCDGNADNDASCPEGYACAGGECLEVKTWYQDRDGDSYGNPDAPKSDVYQPVSHVADNTDCDDDRAEINPGAVELCNGIDEDCDGIADNGTTCPEGTVCDGENGCIPEG